MEALVLTVSVENLAIFLDYELLQHCDLVGSLLHYEL